MSEFDVHERETPSELSEYGKLLHRLGRIEMRQAEFDSLLRTSMRPPPLRAKLKDKGFDAALIALVVAVAEVLSVLAHKWGH